VIRGGVVYKPSIDSLKMHWKAGAAADGEGVPFELNSRRKMILGAVFVKQDCPIIPGRDNAVLSKDIGSHIKELGTWPVKWSIREKQVGISGGQFINAAFNATWIKSGSRTRKQKGLEQVDLDFLDQLWGLLVSVCTGVAQRVVLREVLAEVMLPMTDGWIENPLTWQTLISTATNGGLIEALKRPSLRGWAKALERDLQHALRLSIEYTLHKISWTGLNDAGELVVACTQYGNSDACIHVDRTGLAFILKDTEHSATFACLTNTCFIPEEWP
jgi:hypothetical protein